MRHDTGGHDRYVNVPSNPDVDTGCAVVIDGAGNDLYLSDAALESTGLAEWAGRKSGGNLPGPAGALLGYTMLIDNQGDDLYRTHRAGLGCGRYGVSVVLDKAGNDRYDAYQNSEGYGEFGVGILEDLAGNDRYDCFTQSQGYGFVKGSGALIDRGGDDLYMANDTVIDFPAAQSDKHNNSMAQGVGNGYRRDYIDVHSLAGGVGLLFDQAGNDTYSSAIFGQGVGYWEGVGMLWDASGSDSYSGQWYVQGACAHFAVGYLEDVEGDETAAAKDEKARTPSARFAMKISEAITLGQKMIEPSTVEVAVLAMLLDAQRLLGGK